MPDRIVWIKKFGANRTHFRPRSLSDKFGQPGFFDDINVVIDQPDDAAVRLRYREIIDGRMIERLIELKNPHSGIRGYFIEIFEDLRLDTVIVDDKRLKRPVIRSEQDSVETLTQ